MGATLAVMSVLAIDAGTTGVTALLVAPDGPWPPAATRSSRSTSRAAAGSSTSRRRSGRPPSSACRQAAAPRPRPAAGHRASASPTSARRRCCGTATTLAAPRRAIVWQDRRTARLCDELREAGHEDRVRELTGLRLDPYFTGTKLTWLADERAGHLGRAWPTARVARRHGRLLPGRPDDRRGAGTSPTRPTPRARCCSTSPRAGGRAELCELLGSRSRRCPRSCRRTASSGAPTRPRSSGSTCPIAGIAGDQQAALFGQACFAPGDVEVHLRHRLVRARQHRRDEWPAPGAGC